MKERLFDWFLDRQLIIAVVLGGFSLSIVFFLDSNFLPALLLFLLSLPFIFAGRKLYTTETSENWLRFSYLEILKNIVGGVLMLLGWGILLRNVLARAVAAMIVNLG